MQELYCVINRVQNCDENVLSDNFHDLFLTFIFCCLFCRTRYPLCFNTKSATVRVDLVQANFEETFFGIRITRETPSRSSKYPGLEDRTIPVRILSSKETKNDEIQDKEHTRKHTHKEHLELTDQI